MLTAPVSKITPMKTASSCSLALENFDLLRRINPSPFDCYLNIPGIEIILSPPERPVSLKGSIAGTRPRGYTPP